MLWKGHGTDQQIYSTLQHDGTNFERARQVGYFASSRGIANAIVAAGLALGPAVGTLGGGLILAAWGWRAIFLVFGTITLLWLAPWRSA